MKKFFAFPILFLIAGFVLFGVLRYTVNPKISASSFCKKSPTCVHGLILNDSGAFRLRYTADGRYLFGAGGDRINSWDTQDNYSSNRVGGYSVKSFVLSGTAKDERWLVVAKDKEIRVFDYNDKRLFDFSIEDELPGNYSIVDSITFESIQDLIAIKSGDKLKLWNAKHGTYITELPHPANIRKVASTSGLIATGLSSGEVVLWPVEDFSQYRIIQVAENPVTNLQFDSSGQHFVSSSSEGEIKLWSVADGSLVNSFEKVNTVITGLSVSKDSSILAAGYSIGLVTLWDTETAKELTSWSYSQAISEVAFSPVTTHLAVSLSDKAEIVTTDRRRIGTSTSLSNNLEDSYVEVKPGVILIEDMKEYF